MTKRWEENGASHFPNRVEALGIELQEWVPAITA
jgi:hypothetical protein